MRIFATIVLFLIIQWNLPCMAKDKFQKIEAVDVEDSFIFDHDSNIPRTKFDKDIDSMIFDRLGEDYRRANVFDFYPLEVKERMSQKDKFEMIDYYDYARRELEIVSRSKLLSVVKKDLNLDGKTDYAVLLRNTKKDKNYLAIINFTDTYYLEKFEEDCLELVNYGSFPTTIVTKDEQNKTISSPVLKLISFDIKESKVLYYDRNKDKWREEAVKL